MDKLKLEIIFELSHVFCVKTQQLLHHVVFGGSEL